jgi:hypothetical protein
MCNLKKTLHLSCFLELEETTASVVKKLRASIRRPTKNYGLESLGGGIESGVPAVRGQPSLEQRRAAVLPRCSVYRQGMCLVSRQ